jgi:hypothetical protein
MTWSFNSGGGGEQGFFSFPNRPGRRRGPIQWHGQLFCTGVRRLGCEGNCSHSWPRFRMHGAVPPRVRMPLQCGAYPSIATTLPSYEEALCQCSLSKDARVSFITMLRITPIANAMIFPFFSCFVATQCLSFRPCVCPRGTLRLTVNRYVRNFLLVLITKICRA